MLQGQVCNSAEEYFSSVNQQRKTIIVKKVENMIRPYPINSFAYEGKDYFSYASGNNNSNDCITGQNNDTLKPILNMDKATKIDYQTRKLSFEENLYKNVNNSDNDSAPHSSLTRTKKNGSTNMVDITKVGDSNLLNTRLESYIFNNRIKRNEFHSCKNRVRTPIPLHTITQNIPDSPLSLSFDDEDGEDDEDDEDEVEDEDGEDEDGDEDDDWNATTNDEYDSSFLQEERTECVEIDKKGENSREKEDNNNGNICENQHNLKSVSNISYVNLRPILVQSKEVKNNDNSHIFIESPKLKIFHAEHKNIRRTPRPGYNTYTKNQYQTNLDKSTSYLRQEWEKLEDSPQNNFTLKMIQSSMLKRRSLSGRDI